MTQETPLEAAIKADNLKVGELIFNLDTSVLRDNGFRALNVAIEFNRVDFVRLFRRMDPFLQVNDGCQDIAFLTPIRRVFKTGNIEIYDLLQGIDRNDTNKELLCRIRVGYEFRQDDMVAHMLRKMPQYKLSNLSSAAAKVEDGMASYLIETLAMIGASKGYLWPLVKASVERAAERGNRRTVESLLSGKAGFENATGRSPFADALHIALENRHFDCASSIMSFGHLRARDLKELGRLHLGMLRTGKLARVARTILREED